MPPSSVIEMGTIPSQDDAVPLEQPLNLPEGTDLLATPQITPQNPSGQEHEVRRRQKRFNNENSNIEEDPLTASEQETFEDEDPHAVGLGGDLKSAVAGIIKGMVGPAILYLPHGFATTGYALAIPIIFISTTMYLYSSRCLLDAWKSESLRDYQNTLIAPTGQKRRMLTFPELANRAFGSHGETAVKTGIALMQSGVCLTYLIFVPQNLHTSMLYLAGINLSPRIWLIIMVLIEIPLSWINDIRKLTCTNFSANILILYGLLLCLGFSFQEAIGSSDSTWWVSIWERVAYLEPFRSQWFLFIGTSVLLFEGSITLLVPLQESVLLEEERQRFPTVYRKVILSIICFYIFFGLACWAAFGDDVHTVLTTSLPSGILATTVQLAYSLAVLMTYPLQNFPALEIATRSISSLLIDNAGFRKNSFLTRRNVISSFLVLALAIVALFTMNSLDKVVSLMGSLLGCPIAFCVPPLIHTQLCSEGLTTWRRSCNQLVAVAGLVAMVLASIETLVTW